MLKISKNTLRYYDRIQLLSPSRNENQYRSYSEKDILDLKYISVLKFAGFSLSSIRKVLENKQCEAHPDTSIASTLQLLHEKTADTEKKIEVLTTILHLLEVSIHALKNEKAENPEVISNLVSSIYESIQKGD